MPASYNYITLRASDGTSVTGLRGDNPPSLKSGYGGWNVVTRPKRIGATQWDGKDPLRMEIPLLFDGWPYEPIEDRCTSLETMAGLNGKLPPTITSIVGDVPHKDLNWVIEDLTWGTQTIYRPGGRVRQDVTVHLLQKIDDLIVTEDISTRPGVPSVYVWRQGDTLQRVATRFYGDPNDWQKIADYNNIRDPSNIKPGTKINLP